MAKVPAIYQSYASNLFSGIAPTSTVAASTTYSLSTLTYLRPDYRVKFGNGTLTLTWSSVSSSIQGDIFVLPMSNLDAGSAVATLTNSSGLSQALTVPALPEDSIPLTTVIDLSGSFSLAQRKAATWNLVISANSVNVTLGGAIALYGPKTTFLSQMAGDNFGWDFTESEVHGRSEKQNEHLTRFILDLQTRQRVFDCVLHVNTSSGLAAIKTWYRSAHGGALPSLFWPDPNVSDALLGTWSDLTVRALTPTYKTIALTFTELSKGIPLL